MLQRCVSTMIIFGFFLVLGCAARQTAASEPESSPDVGATVTETAFQPAPFYADLFEKGRIWRYRAVRQRAMWDDQDPNAHEDGNVTTRDEATYACRATDVRTFVEAAVVDIECDEGDNRIAGVYAADADGLWRLSGFPESASELASLRGDSVIISATPREVHEREEFDEGEAGEFGQEFTVSSVGDTGWCVGHSSWGGDESGETICFETGAGISSFEHGFAGGSIQTERVELMR